MDEQKQQLANQVTLIMMEAAKDTPTHCSQIPPLLLRQAMKTRSEGRGLDALPAPSATEEPAWVLIGRTERRAPVQLGVFRCF